MIVQTRYSVFGFDGMQTDSPEEAQRRSLLVLGGVAVGSALFGAAAFWLGRVLLVRLRRPRADDSLPEPSLSEDHPITVGALVS
jgi:hypothetical protein